jgi:regulator of sigma E protease
MITLIAFIVTIGILVTIHEYGHFQVARWCGVKVLKFSIGFGKPLFTKVFGKDKTEFVLAAIPLGGFVKMLDENELKAEREQKAEQAANPELAKVNYSEADLKRAFNRQSVWKRIAIVSAGPIANLLLAILLYWLLFMLGVTGTRAIIGEVAKDSLAAQASMTTGEVIQKINGEPVSSWQEVRWILLEASLEKETLEIETINQNKELFLHRLSFEYFIDNSEADVLKKIGLQEFRPAIPAVIGEILPNSAAEQAGFQADDKVLSVEGLTINDWEQVVNVIKASPNKKLWFEIERAGKTIRLAATPKKIQDNGESIGRMGAAVKINQKELDKLLVEFHYSPLLSLQKAATRTWDTSIFSLKMLGKMLMGQVSLKSISGPVTIADYAGKSANMGLKSFLSFLALVSISIGVLNLLPIPVLDGGHLMYYMVEIFKGSPVSESIMLVGQKIGFAVLGLLMTLAIFNDFNRLLT